MAVVEAVLQVVEDPIRRDHQADDSAGRLEFDPVDDDDRTLTIRFENVVVDPVAERAFDLLFRERERLRRRRRERGRDRWSWWGCSRARGR